LFKEADRNGKKSKIAWTSLYISSTAFYYLNGKHFQFQGLREHRQQYLKTCPHHRGWPPP